MKMASSRSYSEERGYYCLATLVERTVRPAELDTADEIFSTGNYAKVQPCTNYNGRALQPGPLARKARELYFDWAERHWRVLPKAT